MMAWAAFFIVLTLFCMLAAGAFARADEKRTKKAREGAARRAELAREQAAERAKQEADLRARGKHITTREWKSSAEHLAPVKPEPVIAVEPVNVVKIARRKS